MRTSRIIPLLALLCVLARPALGEVRVAGPVQPPAVDAPAPTSTPEPRRVDPVELEALVSGAERMEGPPAAGAPAAVPPPF